MWIKSENTLSDPCVDVGNFWRQSAVAFRAIIQIDLRLGYERLGRLCQAVARVFSYHNTFYHQEPKLDITNVPESEYEKYDFLISSDVMEHVPKDVDKAFTYMAKMLKPGGFLVLTVPYKPEGDHEEFYPDLHEYRLISTAGKTFLYNRTSKGVEQIYDNLVFHGGDGFTLFMRMFSESGLIKILENSGFDGGIKIYRDDDPRYGIVWPIAWCLAIVARKAHQVAPN